MNLFLIGYRCTGKTSVGKLLSQKIRKEFWDTDAYIRQTRQSTITQIVEKYGWETFRAFEKKALITLTEKKESAVIATGGGIIIDPENIAFLKHNGYVIWLYADLETIVGRMKSDHNSNAMRPALTNEDLIEETRQVMAARNSLYEKTAHSRFDSSIETPEMISDRILETLKNKQLI